MKLRHFSATKIAKLHEYASLEQEVTYKPKGFWVSDESDHGWKAWCKGERWNLGGLQHEYEVVLADNANVLHINTLRQLDEFHETYSVSKYPEMPQYVDNIDWRAVASKYDGIIITPYFWQRRLAPNFMWYYGWDCASGCFWNINVIKELREVTNAKRTKRIERS